MSITAYKIEAVGHDRTGEDYGYVNIMYRYGNKQPCPRPDQCEKMEVMWANESVYGPPAPGSKVGDSIQTWLMGSWNCGVFTHWEIAQRLMDAFTGLKLKELEWFENPREKTLKNGKPRARRAKWLPEREADLVYLYADHYIDARNPTPAETDFFTVTRMDAWGVSTWFMCTPQAAEKLIAMDYDNLPVRNPPGGTIITRINRRAFQLGDPLGVFRQEAVDLQHFRRDFPQHQMETEVQLFYIQWLCVPLVQQLGESLQNNRGDLLRFIVSPPFLCYPLPFLKCPLPRQVLTTQVKIWPQCLHLIM
jgi:hypothetical protein